MCRDAFLGRSHQPICERPFSQSDVTRFHDAAGTDSELTVAVLTLIQASADFVRRVCGDRVDASRVRVAAMSADRAIRPADRFKIGASLILVGKDRIGEIDRHVRTSSMPADSTYSVPFVKGIVPFSKYSN